MQGGSLFDYIGKCREVLNFSQAFAFVLLSFLAGEYPAKWK